MASERVSFEVQGFKNGRWYTQNVVDHEAEAQKHAQTVLGNGAYEGARIVRNWTYRDGSMDEKVVFEKKKDQRGKEVLRITRISSPPVRCEKPRDYFSLDSRIVMGRIFQTYLEEVHLTPTELLHVAKEIARLRDRDNLYSSAIDLVSSLQTQGTEMNSRQRSDEIYPALDQIYAQAKRAERLDLPKVGTRFSNVLSKVRDIPNETPEYLAMVSLSRELCGVRDWFGKLDRLCDLAQVENEQQSVLMLDTVIADVLGAKIADQLIGSQNTLCDLIFGLLDLSEGNFNPEGSEVKDIAEKLNGLFAKASLPGSRRCITELAVRYIRSPNPLNRHNPAKEMEDYQRLISRLLGPKGMVAGSAAAEALTMRGARFVEQGGATGRRAAINNTVNALPDRAQGVMYLAELSKTDFAKEHIEDIVQQIDKVMEVKGIHQMTDRRMTPREKMTSVTSAFHAARDSALPDEVISKVTDHMDAVLERYLVDDSIIEKLDHPEDSLRDRAVRLVKFISAGVLPDGRAQALARERVIKLLRQRNFDQHFVEDIEDPARAQRILREFHKMLVKAGFGV